MTNEMSLETDNGAYMSIQDVPMDLHMWDDFCSSVSCTMPSAEEELSELMGMINEYHQFKDAYDLLFSGDYNAVGCRILISLWNRIMIKGIELFDLMGFSIQHLGSGEYYIYGVGTFGAYSFRSSREKKPERIK